MVALAVLSRFIDARTQPRPVAHGGRGIDGNKLAKSWVCTAARVRSAGRESEVGVGGLRRERLLILETNIDDLSPQVMAYTMEELLSAGALDVWATPILMKKGRPGTTLRVLCVANCVDLMMNILLTVSTLLTAVEELLFSF